jgi:hypothetical protein
MDKRVRGRDQHNPEKPSRDWFEVVIAITNMILVVLAVASVSGH